METHSLLTSLWHCVRSSKVSIFGDQRGCVWCHNVTPSVQSCTAGGAQTPIDDQRRGPINRAGGPATSQAPLQSRGHITSPCSSQRFIRLVPHTFCKHGNVKNMAAPFKFNTQIQYCSAGSAQLRDISHMITMSQECLEVKTLSTST